MAPLEGLRFDNTVLLELPVDESQQKGVRQVRGAIYSLVEPTPLSDPRLVVASPAALQLLGLDAAEVRGVVMLVVRAPAWVWTCAWRERERRCAQCTMKQHMMMAWRPHATAVLCIVHWAAA